MRTFPLAVSLVATVATRASTQQLPILEPDRVRHITQEVSGDAAYEHIRFMTQFHRPRAGADGLWRVAEYYEQKAREYGLTDVRLIRQASTTRPWNARSAELWIVEPAPERLASYVQSQLHLADNSRAANVTAELIDAGAGVAESDYAGKDVAGKIVLAHGAVNTVMREAVRRGAHGVVWYPDPWAERSFGYPEQLRWTTISSGPIDGVEPTFAFVLSLRQGTVLRNRLAQARQPIRVRATVDAGFTSGQGADPWQVMVEAFIRGSEPDLPQDVILTGHLQEEEFSANDDASGSASTLEVARSLNQLITDGRLPRPRRNLRFWWVTEISSQRQYFADNPEAHRRLWVNVNQDMVGADQSQDVLRTQNVTRVPATRFHFLNDVAEAVIEYLVAANNDELAVGQSGVGRAAPYYSRLGSRHRYNAKTIFFHNNTDHMTFNEAPIGVPAITFTNWPDNYIHSTDDDLWNIDRTQLGRNAAAVALIAYVMASADTAAVPRLAAETVGRGAERMSRNLRLGLSWISADGDKAAAYHRATAQVRYAAERERLAAGSLASAGAPATLVTVLLDAIAQREAVALREIESHYRAISGGSRLPVAQRSEVETRLAALRPVLAGGPKEFLTGRGRVEGVSGLHGLMAFETLNAVNGQRTGLDIYRFVAAEAREAGEYYYGRVTPEAVLQYLENAAQAG
ncbi:MAG TPA: M28 family peptidase, partial [Gemmatimonadales bacterium]|nr:M28 family peptidase [Gemmatimonadales bacterium]